MTIPDSKTTEQNSALLHVVTRNWKSRLTGFIEGLEIPDLGSQGQIRFCALPLQAQYRSAPDGSVAGWYSVSASHTDDDSSSDCLIRIENWLHESALLASLGDCSLIPPVKGVWRGSALQFRLSFVDRIPLWIRFGEDLWNDLRSCIPETPPLPSSISIIVRQASDSSWLLDIAFLPSSEGLLQSTSGSPHCRLEFWHYDAQTATPHHPQDVERLFDDILHDCDQAAQEVRTSIDEIDELLAALEDRKSECEENLRKLEAAKLEVQAMDDPDWSFDKLRSTVLRLHENELTIAEDSHDVDQFEKLVADACSQLDNLRGDAESLELEVSSIATDADMQSLFESSWTNAQYARGQRMLRESGDHLPIPDLSFLGEFQPLVRKLSSDAQKILNTAAVLAQMSIGRGPVQFDFGPEIASMAKACERIMVDVIEGRAKAIENDLSVQAVRSDVNFAWNIPEGIVNRKPKDLKDFLTNIVKSFESSTPFKWNGMANKCTALILFGGWITVRTSGTEYCLNPLGTNRASKHVQSLPQRLNEFKEFRNGFVHHDLADYDDLIRTWRCFQDCLRGLLEGFYAEIA